jgi:predicted permease
MNDLRFAFRQLAKNPGFTAVAVLTLALAIGANTTMFSVVDAVLIRPLPFPDSGRLVTILGTSQRAGNHEVFEAMTDPDFKSYREQTHAFESMASYGGGQSTLLTGEEAERLASAEVTVDFFAMLGVRPLLGRTFRPEEHEAGHQRVTMLSEKLWRTRFGGNPSVVGQDIELDGNQVTVAGVLPARFNFPRDCQIWTPLVLKDDRGNAYHRVMARLKPGVTLEQAQSEMNTVADRLAMEFPKSNAGGGVSLVPAREHLVQRARTLLFVFLGAVGFVLFIACANVANLLLSRATSRQTEIVIRSALGASRKRIVMQVLTESVVLALAGGFLGFLFASWGVTLLVSFIPSDLVPRVDEVKLDGRILTFNFLVSVLTGLCFGLAPACQATKTNLSEALKEGGRRLSVARRHQALRQGLVAAQTAISLVLLIGSGLLLRSFVRLSEVELGFNPDKTLTMNVALPAARYPTVTQMKAFYGEILTRTRAVPGVISAGIANAVPLGGGVRIYGDFKVEGQPEVRDLFASKVAVSPDYFRTIGVQLLKGRSFAESDDAEAPGVVIVSERLARHLWPNQEPLGRRIQLGIGANSESWLSVVGVVHDVRQDDLRADPPQGVYVPYQQVFHTFLLDTMTVAARTAGKPGSVAPTLRKIIQAVDPALPVYNVRTMGELVSWKVAHPRFNAWLIGAFSGIALLLALVGIYGALSYSVAQRTHEIGVRSALGARRADVMSLVIGQGMRAVLAGLLIGGLAACALTRYLAHQLYSVTPTDPMTFAVVLSAFVAVALVACLIPALRATRIDPQEALRYE